MRLLKAIARANSGEGEAVDLDEERARIRSAK
jgi:hypothetical protein